MTYNHCDCGLAREIKSGYATCEHCDQPCAKRGCDQCATYSKTVSKRVA